MKNTLLIVVVTLLLPAVARAQDIPPHIGAILKQIRAADKDQLAVSEEDGRFMRLMVLSTKAKRALEIGAASGYSAIWIGLGLKETGGHLVTIEYDKARAAQAAANIRKAGLSDIVTVVQGDALTEIPKVSGSFDFVFCDAWKRDYQKYFTMVFPALNHGGVFLAHNVINKGNEMADFLKTIRTDPRVVSSIVSPGSEGISISYKR
ncbi:MAG: O-methyltransferase [Vicinamibacterales bacterium]|nr:O-methyltransferase [Vicinamibacterales bacterium]